ncbi:MAG TPA: hypothetical protein VKY74_27215 [Chloroflexia bacterium]|nr:hypothetical protein [Chloroflexia bacterium]
MATTRNLKWESTINRWRKVVYPILALLIVAVFGLSLYEDYTLDAGPDVSAYMGVPADPGVLPRDDLRGGFLQLKPGADSRFPSSLVQLVETDTPGVITTTKALLVDGAAIHAVIIHQTTIDVNTGDYRVYPVAQDPPEMVTQRLPGGHILLILPKSGIWPPGSYVVDVPSGGMFDTSRVYYAFAVK